MARIYQRTGKKGSYWYLDYAVDGRRVRKCVGRSKKLAELALADTQVKIERREIGFAQTDRKLDDLIAEYLKHVRADGIAYSHDLSVAVLERFKGHVAAERLKDLNHLKIENYKNWRQELAAGIGHPPLLGQPRAGLELLRRIRRRQRDGRGSWDVDLLKRPTLSLEHLFGIRVPRLDDVRDPAKDGVREGVAVRLEALLVVIPSLHEALKGLQRGIQTKGVVLVGVGLSFIDASLDPSAPGVQSSGEDRKGTQVAIQPSGLVQINPVLRGDGRPAIQQGTCSGHRWRRGTAGPDSDAAAFELALQHVAKP